jgi:hypothetical protein
MCTLFAVIATAFGDILNIIVDWHVNLDLHVNYKAYVPQLRNLES